MPTLEVIARVAVLVIVCSLTGCATRSRDISEPSAPPADSGLSTADANLSASLNYLIVTNGPGSWMDNAPWDEYVLTMANRTDSPMIIGKISLIDPRGMFIDSASTPDQVEQKSSDLASEYGKLGMSVAVGQAAAVAGVGGIFGPIRSLFGITRDHYKRQEQQAIRKEFNRRHLVSFRLSSHQRISGSAFFPIIPEPKGLIVNYRKGNEVGMLEISLEKFQRLPSSQEKGN